MEAALQKPTPAAVAETAQQQQPAGAEHYFTPISPYQVNAKNNRVVDFVALNTNQPATYIGKGAVRSYLPVESGNEDPSERNGHHIESKIPKPRSVRQHMENGTWKSSQENPPRRKISEPRMELHNPDLRPLSPPLILDYSSFDRTFDGTYDDLLGMFTFSSTYRAYRAS